MQASRLVRTWSTTPAAMAVLAPAVLRMSTRHRVIAAVLAVAAVGLTGCADGGTPATPQPTTSGGLTVTSDAFADGGRVPSRYTCFGAGSPPPLAWSGDAAATAAFALVVDDPDAPGGTFVHWVAFDLPADTSRIEAGALPAGARQAKNSAGTTGWTPPCPPSGTHHYRFTVYALRTPIGLPDGASARQVLSAIGERALAQGRLVGTVAHQ